MLEIEIGKFLNDFELNPDTFDSIDELEDALRRAEQAYMREVVKVDDDTGLNNRKLKEVSQDMEISDALYDRAMDVLKRLKPDSELVTQIYESNTGDEVELDADYLHLISEDKMKSIMTVKGYDSDEFKLYQSNTNGLFREGVEFHYSLKLNGWGIQLFYRNGKFANAYSRARSSKGLDLTDLMTVVLRKYGLLDIQELHDTELCCIRGELHLPMENLNKAREYNSKIVHPLSAVNSLRGAKVPDEYKQLLAFSAYRYIDEDFHFASRSDEYDYLQRNLNFDVPFSSLIECEQGDDAKIVIDFILDAVSEREGILSKPDANGVVHGVYSDGIVVQVNKATQFKEAGGNDKYDFGAVAIKMGLWEQNNYSGYVQYISWSNGKTKQSPVAIVGVKSNLVKFEVDGQVYNGLNDLIDNYEGYEYIADNLDKYAINYEDLGVVTGIKGQGGNRVRRVPLSNLNGLLALGVRLGGVIHFKYGAESGVVPCDEYGNLYLSDAIQSAYRSI